MWMEYCHPEEVWFAGDRAIFEFNPITRITVEPDSPPPPNGV